MSTSTSLVPNKTTVIALAKGERLSITGDGAWAFQAFDSSGLQLDSGSYSGPDVIGAFQEAANVNITPATGARLEYESLPAVAGAAMFDAKNRLITPGGQTLIPMIQAGVSAPKKLMLAGASQYSRCSTEVLVSSAQILGGVLYITHALLAVPAFVTGQEAFCAVDGHFVYGNVTIVSDTTLTMPAPGRADTVANTSGTQFLHFLGMHTGSSWIGHLQSRYGGGMKFVGNISQHGATVQDVANRMNTLLAAIDEKQPDIIVFEPGWGNSLNKGDKWEDVMPIAWDNLGKICKVVPLVILATLPPPAPGSAGMTSTKIGYFNRLNHMLLSGDVLADYPNIVIVNSTDALLDYTRTDIGSIAGVHSDDLHWTPLGAFTLANSCFGPVLDAFIPKLPVSRAGKSHVWANGNNQLFDGLLDATGYTPVTAGSSGTLDNTMTVSKQGGAGTAVCSKVLRSNGLYAQRFVLAGLAATVVYTITVPGASGALLKDRIVPGRTYRPIVRMAMSGIAGTIKAVSVVCQISMTGHAGTMPRTIWAGRSQEGYVEGGASVFPQTAAETARDYWGTDFTVPATATVTDFLFTVLVRSGASSSGITIDIEDITLLDVTE